jgi:hypothetical protein
MNEKKQMAGRAGYLKALENHPDFHRLGGQARVVYDMWQCECHGVGLGAYLSHPGNKLKGKAHRYQGQPYRKAGSDSE